MVSERVVADGRPKDGRCTEICQCNGNVRWRTARAALKRFVSSRRVVIDRMEVDEGLSSDENVV
jgi:hypothetical protein